MLALMPTFQDLLSNAPILLIPLWQVLTFVMLISVAAVLERHRLVLIFAYTFSLHWVFIENLKLLSVNRISIVAVVVFLVFGLLGLVLTLYQMLTSRY